MRCNFQLKALKRSGPDRFFKSAGHLPEMLIRSCFHKYWELSVQRVSWEWKGN